MVEDPKSAKTDGALYKIGLSFEELGFENEAAAFFEELIAKFPRSVVVNDAKNRLGAIRHEDKYGRFPQCDTGQRCGHSCISRLETCTK